jgi:hypothetical protein
MRSWPFSKLGFSIELHLCRSCPIKDWKLCQRLDLETNVISLAGAMWAGNPIPFFQFLVGRPRIQNAYFFSFGKRSSKTLRVGK